MHRYLLITFLFLGHSLLYSQSFSRFETQTTSFLKAHTQNGKVQYKNINTTALEELIQAIGTINYGTFTKPQQKAFLINTYNLLVIQAVIEQYPIASPNEITGFFDWNKYIISGKKKTLNELEKELLVEFKDPRLHFVLVCGAKGCPPIIPEAYSADNLEEQLEQQTRLAINDASFIYLNTTEKIAYLSEIFRWYVADFKPAGGIRTFINQYRQESIPANYKIRYYDYNWQLNDANPVLRSGNPAFFRASRLLKKGQSELKIFNSLYTQKQYDGFDSFSTRSSYFSSFFQYLHGSNKWYNLGFDFVIRSHIVNDFVENAPFKAIQAFNFDEYRKLPAGDSLRNAEGAAIKTYGRFGLSHFGPKIKLHPFKNNRNLSFQQTIYLPLVDKVDGQTISFTQLFYDKLIGTRSQLFAEASLWTPLRPTFRIAPFIKVFYSYFPTAKWTIYGMVGLPYEVGVGTKLLVSKQFEIELLYTNYALQRIAIKDRVAQTFNLGFRFMH